MAPSVSYLTESLFDLPQNPRLLRLHFPWLPAQLLRELFLEAAVYLETRLRESAQAPCGKHRPLSSGLRLGNGPDQRGQAANTPHSMGLVVVKLEEGPDVRRFDPSAQEEERGAR
ncbi:hypothetical protein Q8A67_020940 [Cirrhinus molitorella]|uniref:Uncharacterized protein n=1 Tax=Cirrhinus molitorella TaxID=172907 RepID=A0AA88TEG5_9TELE|nr:hypothetical protein Q8A67_020940 [Cirrhinus molitorella]